MLSGLLHLVSTLKRTGFTMSSGISSPMPRPTTTYRSGAKNVLGSSAYSVSATSRAVAAGQRCSARTGSVSKSALDAAARAIP